MNESTTPPDEIMSASQTLRRWPLAILLAIIVAVPYLPGLIDGPSMLIMVAGFMGPAAVGLLVLVWWLLASRASGKEKVIGFFGVLVIGAVAMAFLHKSMQGMGAIANVVPVGILAFGVPLLIFAASPRYRLPVSLACAVVGFGYWDLIQSNGVTGRFKGDLDWRWNKTPEELYLEEIALKGMGNPVERLSDVSPITLASAQWPSFRGPYRDGRQPGVTFDEDWEQSPPKQIWKTKIGPGWSSFSVAGDRLFTQEQRGDNEAVLCMNAKTGETLWVFEYPGRFWESVAGAGPRATPTIADEGLFALGADGMLACLSPINGDVVWKTDLKKDANRKPPTWGFSSSPLVIAGLVLVHAGGKDDKGILAFDAGTGSLRWSAPSGDHSYSSPHLATFAGVRGVLMETNQGLQFLNAESGESIWNYDWPIENYRAVQPLVIGDTVMIASTLGEGMRRLKIAHEGKTWQVTEDWSSRGLKPDFNDFVEHKGFVYGFDADIFTAIDAETGERKWKRGRYGNGQVVLLPDADQLLIASETGEIVLVKADPEKLVELGKVPAISGKTWNHPVVIGQRVYLRNAEEAACFEIGSP